ncbi:DUF2254 family protein [Vaginisenegalia massiliensis]|uniref:DUF2254 family protein n=1 Tax=Vaginisenegalia massiliensis TaxID=2058294 RepID=UPI000F52BAB9|nr:DUF2254 family protein [Vaginisenegalia massiliensis]
MSKQQWNQLKQTSWFYPAIFGILSALLAIGLTFMDHYLQGVLDHRVLMPFFISVDLSIQILNTVAVVSATILTFTFSTTMVVLTTFSSQYSPSLVENFLNDTITLKAFGIFFGGFTYTITALLLLDINLDQKKVIVASFCIFYVLIDLIYFNRFIRAVINYIQPSGLIVRLNREAEKHIDQYASLMEGKQVVEWEELPLDDYPHQYDIMSHQDGYLQEIRANDMMELVNQAGLAAVFHQVVGDFVTKDTAVATLLSHHEVEEKELEILRDKVQKTLQIGFVRTGEQDFLFSIQKIMDISMKAISNTVYAPNSTLSSMNVIRVLLRTIAGFEDGYRLEQGQNKETFVAFKTLNFLQILEDIYDPVFSYGYTNGIIVKYIFDSLATIKEGATQENREKVNEYVKNLQDLLENNKEQHVNYHYQKDFEKILAD